MNIKRAFVMSRRSRPLGEYLRAARKLAETKPLFIKYVNRTDLEPHEKSAIARSAHLPPLPVRTDADYRHIAARLSPLVPSIRKYKRAKKMNSGVKSYISKMDKLLRYSGHLIPVTKKEAKKFKDMLYAPGVQAIPMHGVGDNAKLRRVKKEMILSSNGRDWILWRVSDPKPYRMRKTAEKIFSESFDLEKILALAKKAFEKHRVIRIYLWSQHGIVGSPHKTLSEFTQWLHEQYSQYQNVEQWVNGIAILIRDSNRIFTTAMERRNAA